MKLEKNSFILIENQYTISKYDSQNHFLGFVMNIELRFSQFII